jgi:hypothetical protein
MSVFLIANNDWSSQLFELLDAEGGIISLFFLLV